MKQFIWDRWSSGDIARANPGILNSFLGVEISDCTGNARRVPLKHILLMPSIQPLPDHQIPRWKTTAWGMSFQKALVSDSQYVVFSFFLERLLQRASGSRQTRALRTPCSRFDRLER
jgi:hypothetical protein